MHEKEMRDLYQFVIIAFSFTDFQGLFRFLPLLVSSILIHPENLVTPLANVC